MSEPDKEQTALGVLGCFGIIAGLFVAIAVSIAVGMACGAVSGWISAASFAFVFCVIAMRAVLKSGGKHGDR